MNSKLFLALAPLVVAYPPGFDFNMEFDYTAQKIKMEVKTPKDTYFGIAYGEGMLGVDIVRFIGSGDGVVQDMWSNFYWAPDEDKQQDYYDTEVIKDGTSYLFTTYRDIITSDPNNEDF